MKRKRYLFAVIVLAVAVGLGFAFWQYKVINAPKNPDTKTVVNVYGLKGVSSIGMIKMIDDKAVIGNNYDVKYQIADSPEILMAKLTTKEVDMAAVPTNLAATIYNKGMDYKIAAVTSWGVFYVLNSDESVKSINDLKGKTINVINKGSTPDFVLRYILTKNGINPDKDVKLDYTLTEATEASQAMIADKIKTCILPEPFVTMILSQNKKAGTLVNIQDEWKKVTNAPLGQTCLVVRGEFAKNNPQAVSKLLDLNKASIEWVNANPTLAGPLVEKNGVGIKAPVVVAAIPRCNLKYEDAVSAKDSINSFLKVLFDFSPKDVGGKMPDEGFFYKR